MTTPAHIRALRVSDQPRVMTLCVGVEVKPGQDSELLTQVIARALREAVEPNQGFCSARSIEETSLEQVFLRESAGTRARSLHAEDARDGLSDTA